MSFFQDKQAYSLKGDDSLDVIHLGKHGCDVVFCHYEKDSHLWGISNKRHSRNLIIKGVLELTLAGETQRYSTGEWFEVAANTIHDIDYIADCSMIEFWFESKP